MPVNPKNPVSQYVVLWKQHPTPIEPEPQFEQYGDTYDDIAPALKELERAMTNPRCADARLSRRKIIYTELTGNAVEWTQENRKE